MEEKKNNFLNHLSHFDDIMILKCNIYITNHKGIYEVDQEKVKRFITFCMEDFSALHHYSIDWSSRFTINVLLNWTDYIMERL